LIDGWVLHLKLFYAFALQGQLRLTRGETLACFCYLWETYAPIEIGYLKLASLDLIDTGARLSLSLGSRGVAMRWNLIYSFNY